jgi:hypothetical protein
MKVLVVYESMFGNTAAIAEAIVEGLQPSADVDLREIGQTSSTSSVDVIVAGAPTHAFSLSRPQTRQDATDHGATSGNTSAGLREWLAYLAEAVNGQCFAAFDTRVASGHRLPGSAAAAAVRIARGLNYTVLGRKSFLVTGVSGPPGETDRARAWGSDLAAALSHPGGPMAPRNSALARGRGPASLVALEQAHQHRLQEPS